MENVNALTKKASESGIIVLRRLFALPIVNVNTMTEGTGYTRLGAQRVINRVVDLGILKQKDKSERYGRSFINRRMWIYSPKARSRNGIYNFSVSRIFAIKPLLSGLPT